MKFQKGQPKHPDSGRKKGAKNKLPKLAAFLAEADINPTERILKLIPELEPEEQVKAWFELLSYCQGKPRAEENEDRQDEDLLDVFSNISTEQILKLVKEDTSTDAT